MVTVKVKSVENKGKHYDNVVLDCDGYEITLFGLNKEQVYIIKKALDTKEYKFK